MNIEQTINNLKQQYNVLTVVDLDKWSQDNYDTAKAWLNDILIELRKDCFENNERIIFTLTRDYYVKNIAGGLILKNLQILLNEVDITNCFVIVLTTNDRLSEELTIVDNSDNTKLQGIVCAGNFEKIELDKHPRSYKEEYQYGSANPLKIKLSELSEREEFLLTKSKMFCMYPWIHLHAFPTGGAYPCCYGEMDHSLGSTKTSTLQEIWNNRPMQDLRQRMLTEQPSGACAKCYEQEQSGFFSGRQSANKHFGHFIDRVAETQPSGYLDRFEMTYWDIRFSNLCNLSCRSCGHIFSSSWYQDQAQLAGGDWKKHNKVLNFAGRTNIDLWEQLIPHLDYVEQIYFAGGEPLMMEEHYRILDELERRERFDVRLIYNTNFTHVKLKDRFVFDYWKKFKSVSVGASLDAMGARAEYIRKGTTWTTVEDNRRRMLDTCPTVDFYISPTLSIMNALHLPEFHQSWVDQGLIRAQDLNVNILQDPEHYRIDIATEQYKNKIQHALEQHLDWLRPQDHLRRATVGFESAIKFMLATDNSHLLTKFWEKTQQLDSIRQENALEIIPELAELQ
jgi:hypothetical protein